MVSDFDILLYFLDHSDKDFFTTSEIAESFSISQQTISRRLRELEDEGLIKRNASVRGIRISITSKASSSMQRTYSKLKKHFSDTPKASISGKLMTGLGEGKYYLSLRQYREQISQNFCFQPYPGTLNLKVDLPELNDFLSEIPLVKIKGFKTSERTYGDLDAYKVRIEDRIDAAIVIPKRTAHDPSILEVVAPVSVREALKIKDNDKVRLFR